MRRWLLLVLLAVMPLQWSWAAAASVCAHEMDAPASHVGHHEHAHDATTANTDEADDERLPFEHPDCGVCHGAGTAFIARVNDMPGLWTESTPFERYEAVVPDRSPDTLFRPPSTTVA
jgi:cytochrome c553